MLLILALAFESATAERVIESLLKFFPLVDKEEDELTGDDAAKEETVGEEEEELLLTGDCITGALEDKLRDTHADDGNES